MSQRKRANRREGVYDSQIVIDTASGKASAIGFGEDIGSGGGIALSSDGSTGYHSNGLNLVCVIDMTVGECGKNIDVGHRPQGIVLTPDGSTLFVGTTDDVVYTIDTKTNKVTDVISLQSDPGKTKYPVRVAVQPLR